MHFFSGIQVKKVNQRIFFFLFSFFSYFVTALAVLVYKWILYSESAVAEFSHL